MALEACLNIWTVISGGYSMLKNEEMFRFGWAKLELGAIAAAISQSGR